MRMLSKAKMPGKKMQDQEAEMDAALLAEMPEGEEMPEEPEQESAEGEQDMSAKLAEYSDEELQAELDRRAKGSESKQEDGMPRFSPEYGS